MCLAFKAICYKPYGDLQSLPIPIHYWKNLLIDFVMGLLLSTNQKSDNYNAILVIVVYMIKMVYYKPVKVIINAIGLAKVIFNMEMQYYSLSDFIISDYGAIFISKFWLLLCQLLGIKRSLSNTFHLQTNGRTE